MYVDRGIGGYDQVWVAAGTGTDVFAIAPADLIRVTGGVTCDLT